MDWNTRRVGRRKVGLLVLTFVSGISLMASAEPEQPHQTAALALRLESPSPDGSREFELRNISSASIWCNTARLVTLSLFLGDGSRLEETLGLPFNDPSAPGSHGDYVPLTEIGPSRSLRVRLPQPGPQVIRIEAVAKGWTSEGRAQDGSLLRPNIRSNVVASDLFGEKTDVTADH